MGLFDRFKKKKEEPKLAPKPKKTPKRKPQNKKDGDKNLRYSSCSPDIQRGLDKARCKEWQTWKKFNAGVILSKAEVRESTAE